MVISKLLLFGALFFCLKFLLNVAFIKIFKVEKAPYHKEFVSKKHKIINIIVATIVIPVLVLFYYFQHVGIISQMLLLGLCFLLAAIPSVIESIFWWKDDPKSRYYVLCVGEALLFTIFGVIIWQFGIFGLTTI
ncbi:DUF4181 domain-containing protein [Litchfieldia alkalitelluris]|uniref:DUF4181 domain-containing protein n=1 Tax=Litchfieldia alkalitelluris TaxID=304268 RepID=UPI000995E3FC|nr:DUF4181 domain-containing protein [Litchfieldia alkalitelluris]